MKRQSLIFLGPYRTCVQDEPLGELGPQQCCVRTVLSGISAGTELLVYRGQWPEGALVDETISSLAREFSYPLKYGYATVGIVTDVGTHVPRELVGGRVFSFHPHESLFIEDACNLIIIPESVSNEDAVFLPNMETALGLVMDGCPIIGETVVVFGLGVVGLLTVSLLARFPLQRLICLDRYAMRREFALNAGATYAFDPGSDDTSHGLHQLVELQSPLVGADLVYELSGNPSALDEAISICGFSSRLIVGSWYGAKKAELSLGGKFHRSRIRIISSQVSRLDPALTGRWDKKRRIELAWRFLEAVKPSRLITHKIPFSSAIEAYPLLDQAPDKCLQIVFEYEGNI